MKARTLFALTAATLAVSSAALAKDAEWQNKAPADWTAEDTTEILGKSAWVQTISVFPTALVASGNKQDKPTASSTRVPVQARWFSSQLMKQAIGRNAEIAGAKMTDEEKAEGTRPDDRFYEILISADKLDVLNATPFADLAKVTTLESDGQTFPLVTILRPSDLHSSQSQFIFQKGKGIPAGAKSISLKTVWNENKLEFKWDPTKMVWNGSCEKGVKPTREIVGDAKGEKVAVRDLDGDFCPVGPNETRRREVQAAILGSGDEAFNRAISDVRVTPSKGDKTVTYTAYVFYDPAKEVLDPAEAAKVDVMGRKLAMTKAAGKWDSANGSPLKAIVFVRPGAAKPDDFIHASCAEKVAKLEGDAAEKLFKEKLTKPDSKDVPVCMGEEKPAAAAATPKADKTDKKPTSGKDSKKK